MFEPGANSVHIAMKHRKVCCVEIMVCVIIVKQLGFVDQLQFNPAPVILSLQSYYWEPDDAGFYFEVA